MQNIIPPEWMAVLVTLGTVVGTVILGIFYARKPPTRQELMHPTGVLFDTRTIKDLVVSIDALTMVVKEGLTKICVVIADQKEAEKMDLLQEILDELKKAPQPPKTRMPPRA